jgi:hypothetical protein
LAIITILLGLVGLLKAYKSVLSANGSLAIIGASLWLEDISIIEKRNAEATAIKISNLLVVNLFFIG